MSVYYCALSVFLLLYTVRGGTKLFFVFSVKKSEFCRVCWDEHAVGGAQGGRGRGAKGDPPFHPDGGASAPGLRPLTQRMGSTFSRKQSEHRLRRDFVVTLLVTHKRLKNQKTYHDEGKDAMLNDMEQIERSWKFFDSQVILVPAYSFAERKLCLSWNGRCPVRATRVDVRRGGWRVQWSDDGTFGRARTWQLAT